MRSLPRFGLSILVLWLFAVQPVLAYSYPLSSEAIRDAYFLGTEDAERRADAFSSYTRQFPPSESGVHVALIQFQTPFIVIADRVATRISQNLSSYFAPDAEKEYLGKPGICRVRVQVFFPYDYGSYASAPPGAEYIPLDDMDKYAVRLTQRGQEIMSQAHHKLLLTLTSDTGVSVVGMQMDLEYDPAKIDSADSATVEVKTPDGHDVQTTFDLSKLR